MNVRNVRDLQRQLETEKSSANRQLLLKEIWMLQNRPKPEATDKQPLEAVATLGGSRTAEAPAKAPEKAPSATAV